MWWCSCLLLVVELRGSDVGRWTSVWVELLLVRSIVWLCNCMLLVVAVRGGEIVRCAYVCWCRCLVKSVVLRWWRDAVVVDKIDGVEVVCCLPLVVIYCDSHLLVLLFCGGIFRVRG